MQTSITLEPTFITLHQGNRLLYYGKTYSSYFFGVKTETTNTHGDITEEKWKQKIKKWRNKCQIKTIWE